NLNLVSRNRHGPASCYPNLRIRSTPIADLCGSAQALRTIAAATDSIGRTQARRQSRENASTDLGRRAVSGVVYMIGYGMASPCCWLSVQNTGCRSADVFGNRQPDDSFGHLTHEPHVLLVTALQNASMPWCCFFGGISSTICPTPGTMER